MCVCKTDRFIFSPHLDETKVEDSLTPLIKIMKQQPPVVNPQITHQGSVSTQQLTQSTDVDYQNIRIYTYTSGWWGIRAFWSVIYMSPLPITTLPIHITPGLKSTSDWWHFRAVWSDFHDSNPAGNRAIRKNTETRIAAGYKRFPIGFSCFPSGCFKKPAAKRRKTGNGKMCFHPVYTEMVTS